MASSHREHGQDKTRQDCLQLKILSSLEMRCELSLVLFSNAFTPQTRQNCLQYIENCLRLSRTQFTPPRQDKARQSCLVRVRGVNQP